PTTGTAESYSTGAVRASETAQGPGTVALSGTGGLSSNPRKLLIDFPTGPRASSPQERAWLNSLLISSKEKYLLRVFQLSVMNPLAMSANSELIFFTLSQVKYCSIRDHSLPPINSETRSLPTSIASPAANDLDLPFRLGILDLNALHHLFILLSSRSSCLSSLVRSLSCSPRSRVTLALSLACFIN